MTLDTLLHEIHVLFCSMSISFLVSVPNSHLNAVVRKCTAQHLTALVEKISVARLLSGTKDLTDRILPAVSKLAQDSSQDTRLVTQLILIVNNHTTWLFHKLTALSDQLVIRGTSFLFIRYFGRQMLLFLSSHRDFDKMAEKYIPAKDLATIRDTVATLKTKVSVHDCPQ